MCIVEMTRHDALPPNPAVTGMGEMVFEAVTQAVRKLFLNVQLQAAVHPVKLLQISIIAIS
jgi:hypothetical protein